MGDFVVYLTIYTGDTHPPYYVGSTSLKNVESGYTGSPRSKKWKQVVKDEIKKNPSKYDVLVLSHHDSRKDAMIEEERLHRTHNCPNDDRFYNMAYATPNGYFGVSMKGDANPMHGVPVSVDRRNATSLANTGFVSVSSDDGVTWRRVPVEEYYENKENLISPKGAFSPVIANATRSRVEDGTHHFCDPEVQEKIAAKRRGTYKAPDHVKEIVSKSMKEYYSDWENKTLGGNREIWKISLEIYEFIQYHEDPYTSGGKLRQSTCKQLIEYIESLGVDPRLDVNGWRKITEKFRKGWNPKEDNDYLSWRNVNES